MRAWLLVLLSACGYPHLEHVGRVGGTVHGLWDGTSGLVLHLGAKGIDRTAIIAADGPFEIADILADDEVYELTILTTPGEHTCSIAAGGSGKLADVPPVDIACTGPSVAITGSTPIPWTFDPSADEQTIEVSLLTQEIGFTISSPGGALASAQLDGDTVTLDVRTTAAALPLGVTTFAVTVQSKSGLTKTYMLDVDRGTRLIEQAVYVKASNAQARATFGTFFTTFDGDVLAIGAPQESSGAVGVNGDQTDTSKPGAGAVYVFRRNGAVWTQEAYLKASNPDMNDNFGSATAVSGDVIAVGAYLESSSAGGINPSGGAQLLNDAQGAGAVYVFRRQNGTWAQEAYIKAPVVTAGANFGGHVALYGDFLAVGAPETNGGAGAVYNYLWNSGWSLISSQSQAGAHSFGYNVALGGSRLFPTLVVGAADESSRTAGAVYIGGSFNPEFTRIFASDGVKGMAFGASVAIAGDTVVVGAPMNSTGRAYVFERVNNTWTQTAELQASNSVAAWFGLHVAIHGELIAVSAVSESSQATGVNQPPEGGSDSLAPFSGAAYLYRRDDSGWSHVAYIKASNSRANMSFGDDTALSGDTLIVGARNDSSSASGIDPPGGQADTSALFAGALYIFR